MFPITQKPFGEIRLREGVIIRGILGLYGYCTLLMLLKKNKWDLFIFICLETSTTLIGAIVAIQRLWTDPMAPSSFYTWMQYIVVHHPGAVAFICVDTFVFIGAAALIGTQASLIARNVTTNEMENSTRYNYLKSLDGHFQNPYDSGFRRSCTNFLIHGYNDDIVVARKSLAQNGL